MQFQIIIVVLNNLNEKLAEWLSNILKVLAHKVDAVVLPITQDVIQEIMRTSLGRDNAQVVMNRLLERYSKTILHARSWLRIVKPIIEALIWIANNRPVVVVVPSVSIESLIEDQYYTVDLLSVLIRRKLDANIIKKLLDRLRSSFEEFEEYTIKTVEDLMNRYQTSVYFITSCFSCFILFKIIDSLIKDNLIIHVMSLCNKIPPPTYVLHMLPIIYNNVESLSLEKLILYTRRYLMDYVVISESIWDAYKKFIAENPDYVVFCRQLVNMYCPLAM